jgi:transposase
MLRPMLIEPVPHETARVARATFPTGNRDRRLADARETLFTDAAFPTLCPTHGQPALPPWRLALVTILPWAEWLSDCQAADAVRRRIVWTYVLRLELTDPGFDVSVLSECRTRLIVGAAESLLFKTLLRWCRHRHLVKAGGRQRTDSTPILAAVWALIDIEAVGDTWRHALNRLVVAVPEDEVFNQGWSALRPGRAVCTLHAALSTADADHPAPEAISGPASGPTTGSGRRVSGGLCSLCRH